MRNYDRFIPGEEIDVVKQWNFGAIDTAAQVLASQAKARADQEDAAQLASTREQGFAEGYTQGIEQGRRQAQAGHNNARFRTIPICPTWRHRFDRQDHSACWSIYRTCTTRGYSSTRS